MRFFMDYVYGLLYKAACFIGKAMDDTEGWGK